MNNAQITHALYDLALASGGHTLVKPLITGFLQRLLYHTSIGCGVALSHQGEMSSSESTVVCKLETAIGCHTLLANIDTAIALPSALIVGESAYISDELLYKFFLSHCPGTKYVIRLHASDRLVLLLFSSHQELPSWPITNALKPVLRNFGENVDLCAENELKQQSLTEEIQRRMDAELKLRQEYGLFTAGPTVMFRCLAIDRWPITYISPNVEQQFGYSKKNFIKKQINFADLVHPEDLDILHTTELRTSPDGRAYYEIEYRLRDANDVYRWVHDITFPLSTDGTNYDILQGYLLDITERKQNELELRLMATAFDTNEAIAITDAETRFIKVNKAFSKITGYSAEEVLGKKPGILSSGRHDRAFYIGMWERLRHNGNWDGEIWNKRKNGEIYPEWLSISQLRDSNQVVSGYVAHFADISELKKQSEHIEQMAAEERTLAMLLQLSIDESSTNDFLNAVLETLMNSVPWLQILPKAVAFLLEDDGNGVPVLKMHANYGADDTLINTCRQVALGQCLCGKAAQENKIIYASHIDHDHTLTFEHMDDHGHYVIPVKYRNSLIGVYTVYLKPGVSLNEHEISFLQRVADVISLGITKRQSDTALISAKELAEKSNQAKSEFLSQMSHELRTPLNAILGFGQLLEMDVQETQQRDNIDEILKAGRHLLDLINEILDLSKIESGHVSLSMEDIDLAPLLHECLSLSTPIANNYGIAIQLNSPTERINVHGDRVRLKQVLLNLISNGIKYNRKSGYVQVSTSRLNPGVIRIQITDNGTGVPQDQRSKLFEPFNRLGAEKSSIEGTGIGLAISKRIMSAMGGSIGYQPVDSGGSCFWIELPCTFSDSESVDMTADNTVKPDANPEQGGKYTILYIEDNPANLRLVSHLVSHRPHIRLLTAHEPYLGIDLAASLQPDLILLDINLPGMNGYEVLAQLKSIETLSMVPVIAVSANAMPSDMDKGLAYGFSDYITKPIDITKFYATIDAYSRRQQSDFI